MSQLRNSFCKEKKLYAGKVGVWYERAPQVMVFRSSQGEKVTLSKLFDSMSEAEDIVEKYEKAGLLVRIVIRDMTDYKFCQIITTDDSEPMDQLLPKEQIMCIKF